MERGYNEYTMAFINQGIEMGEKIDQEKVRLECGMNAVLEAGSTVNAAARACRVDEAKLAKYIESHLLEVLIQVRGLTMSRGYNEYSMAFINQGIEMGQEKARLDCGMKLVRDGTYSVKGAAELCGVDEAKLADYIESHKCESTGELLG